MTYTEYIVLIEKFKKFLKEDSSEDFIMGYLIALLEVDLITVQEKEDLWDEIAGFIE